MPTKKEDPDATFIGEHQTNQKNFLKVKTSYAQISPQAPKTSNKYSSNETILTSNSKTIKGSLK
jgi:hypothetical protein